MTARSIRLERSREGARADLRIEIPPVNVLDLASLEELARKIGEAPPGRLLVLSGLPRAFSAGVDVAQHAPEPGAIEAMLAAMRRVLAGLCETPAVTLAAVSGACLGGGAELVCACDLVVVAEDARVGFPEIRLACFPPGAAALLPLRVGEARAADWILTGKSVSGREAAEAGFAAASFAADRLAAETDRLAERILGTSASALAAVLPLLRRARRAALTHQLPAAEDAYRTLAGSEDLARAVREFGAARRR
ncbi:MAG: enoyl-CoA hydratase/isomerase family protein [Thermoanaerobaculia bacterium]